MTYSHKLSRRLALNYLPGALATLLLASACASGDLADTNAPGGTPADTPPVASSNATVIITPGSVTAEAHQPVQFTGYARTAEGDSTTSDLEWSSSGGTMGADGVFSADSAGTYAIYLARGGIKGKPSTVVVVPPDTSLTAVVVSPDTATVAMGAKKTFTATGKLADGTTRSSIAVTWSATGGSIDAAGNYTAGQTAGSYLVIAKAASATLADTAKVTIPAAATPTPTPTPAPTLSSVVLTPGTASLQTGATQQFSVSGKMSDGTTAPVSVTWSATGGTISTSGLYTAGSTAGTYRVVATATSAAKADTSTVTVTAPATTTPTSCSSYTYARRVAVSTASQLSSALSNAQAGDLIVMADGTYSGRFTISRSGTSTQPIVVCGSRNAVINAGSTSSNDGFTVKANYVTLSGFTITNALRAIVGQGANHDLFTNLSIHDIGQEGIHLHVFSSNNTVSYNTITNTGLVKAEFGEGVYLGTAVSQWGTYTGGQPDRSDYNRVINNKIGPNVRSEGVDVKEGTTGGLLQGNTFDGHGMVMSQTWVDSWVEIKGNNYQVLDNHGTYTLKDGFQTYSVASGWGNNNVFGGNVADLQASGYGIRVTGVTGTVVRCDNVVTNAGSGMSNVGCK